MEVLLLDGELHGRVRPLNRSSAARLSAYGRVYGRNLIVGNLWATLAGATPPRCSFLERPADGLDGALDQRLVVRQRDEPGLELRGRQHHSAIEQRSVEAREARRVAFGGLGVVARRLLPEEPRQRRAGPAHRDRDARGASGILDPAREQRAQLIEACVRRLVLACNVRSVASPAAIASGLPESVPAW